MKKSVLAIVLCLLLTMTSVASASNFYLIEDSDTRELTEDELWGWTYEALGFVLNELFARHGYHFEEGEKYEAYFEAQDWYEEKPAEYDNQDIYETEMSDVELQNEQLIKDVRKEMRRMGTVNSEGRDVPQIEAVQSPSGNVTTNASEPKQDSAVLDGIAVSEPWVGPYGYELHFEEMILDAERPLKVYSGPGEKYYCGVNGKAAVSTDDVIYVAGWEGSWLLVKYWTNAGPSRVGYVHRYGLTGKVDAPKLELEKREVVVVNDCTYSDDPEYKSNVIGELKAGDKVTFLGTYLCNVQWAYIETRVDGQPVRAFVSADNLSDIESDESAGE